MPVGEMFSCDNSGNRTGPHPDISDPVAGSGQVVFAAAIDNNYSDVTVVAGATYVITCLKGAHMFGIANTDDAENCIWACSSGKTIVIRIPFGKTALHYRTPDTSHVFVLRRLAG